MKLAMALTMDGLVRALRGRAHALAERAEDRYRPTESAVPRRGKMPEKARRTDGRRKRDDVAGR